MCAGAPGMAFFSGALTSGTMFVMAALFVAGQATAQDITLDGVARSVSFSRPCFCQLPTAAHEPPAPLRLRLALLDHARSLPQLDQLVRVQACLG
jgi:hypothetical protein